MGMVKIVKIVQTMPRKQDFSDSINIPTKPYVTDIFTRFNTSIMMMNLSFFRFIGSGNPDQVPRLTRVETFAS